LPGGVPPSLRSELSEGPIYIYLYAGEASGASFVNFTYRGNFARCARDRLRTKIKA
jgi:hypothetical protein